MCYIRFIKGKYLKTFRELYLEDKPSYKEFYDKKLKKYNVTSVDDLPDSLKTKFYDEIELEWDERD